MKRSRKDILQFISYILLPMYIWYRRRSMQQRDILTDCISILGGDMFVSNFFNSVIFSIKDNISKLIDPELGLSSSQRTLNELKVLVNQLPEQFQDSIKSQISSYDNMIGEKTFDNLKITVMSLIKYKPVLAKFNGFDKSLLDKYNNKDHLEELVDNIELGSKGYKISNQVYLHGEPGTGKTYFVNLLSKYTGIPVINFTIGDVSRTEGFRGNGLLDSFANQIVSSNYKNAIIYFDEFDKNNISQILPILLNMTEPKSGHYRCNTTWIKLDTTGFTFIFAGNTLPTDPSLLNRMQVVEFPPMKKEDRISAAIKEMKLYIKEMNIEKDIDNDDIKIIEHMIDVDSNKGVRVLFKGIEAYVIHLVKIKEGKKSSFDPEEFIKRYKIIPSQEDLTIPRPHINRIISI